MILVVGARASGKRAFVCSLGYSRDECSAVPDDPVPVLVNMQELVAAWLDGGSYDADAPLPGALLSKEVITCTEVGSGVVPLDERDRRWRDAVGRTCNRLAQQADCVVRMVCGIPLAIKGELPRTRPGR